MKFNIDLSAGKKISLVEIEPETNQKKVKVDKKVQKLIS
jgi:hypothetical protein